MARGGTPRIDARRLAVRFRAFGRDTAGVAAVEFAFIGMTFFILFFGILQFALVFMAQMYIRDTVSEVATGNTAGTYAGNRTLVAEQICARVIALDNCASRLLLEAQPLASYATTAQPVAGAAFASSVSGTVMMIRARAPVITFVPGLPELHVSAAALYMRP